jgi:predicted negative regulator of RcsB-dependent stress response
MAKISIRRRDPLKQDEVLTFAQRLIEFSKRHRKRVMAGVLAAVLAIMGMTAFRYWQQSRRDAAAAALTEVRPKLESEVQSQEVLKELEKIVSRYGGQPAAREAALYRAHILYQLHKYEEAAQAYKELLADPVIQKEPGMSALVVESLSYCYEGLGKYEEAGQVLQPWLDKASGAFQSDLARRLAWLYERAGKSPEAKKYWEKLLEKPPSPALVPYLKEKLAASPEAASQK